MKAFTTAVTLLAGFAAALPTVEIAPEAELETRQIGGRTRNDLQDGSAANCADVIFIFARGSTESGNLGTLGPSVASGLESEYGDNVWIQGVGGAYRASLGDNALPRGTSSAAIREMVGLFQEADSKCPDATIVAGGYSQGAALTAAAIEDISASIQNKIVGVVLFGYTRNQQNNGGIPGYPSSQLQVFCNTGDRVCEGSLVVTAPHLAYGPDARGPAPEFLISQIGSI